MVELREQLTEAGLPHRYLGLGFRRWSRTDICAVLDRYRVYYDSYATPSKFELLDLLDDLISSRGLTRNHRFLILKGRLPRNASNVVKRNVNGRIQSSPSSSTNSSDGDLGECVVCDKALTISNSPNRPITLTCEHKPDVCRDCLAKSIRIQFKGKMWDNINCPTCNARLGHEDVQAFGTAKTFRRYVFHNTKNTSDHVVNSYSYHKLATAEALSSIPGFRRCLAPGCVSGQIHKGGARKPVVTCSDCGSKSCFTHQTA